MALRLLLLPLFLMVFACAPIVPERSPESPYYEPPQGSRLELLRRIEIPASEVSVWIQDGDVTSYWSADRYRPFCKLEMWSKTDRARTIQPDTFIIERTSRTDRAVRRDEPLRLASNLRLTDNDDDGGPMAYIMSTEMFLDSRSQPDVYRLTCRQWGDVVFPKHVTINEIRQTLQGVFDLQLPSGDLPGEIPAQ